MMRIILLALLADIMLIAFSVSLYLDWIVR